MIFGVGCCGKPHALLILPAVQRQLFAVIIKGLTQTRNIAMAKNAKTSATDAGFHTLNDNILRRQISNDGLCGGQANGFICCVHRKYSDLNAKTLPQLGKPFRC
jgi:hypothetical protein